MIRIRDLKMELRLEGAKVSFITPDVAELDQIISSNQDKPLKADIKPIRSGRSLDANAYLWALCQKIAEVINSTRTEVYKSAIKEVGVFTDIAVRRQDLKSFLASWTGQGIGYQADVFDCGLADNAGEKMKRVRVYLGSHKYDTKQMSVLLDYIVEQAKEMNISTETPDEISRMKSLWKGEA